MRSTSSRRARPTPTTCRAACAPRRRDSCSSPPARPGGTLRVSDASATLSVLHVLRTAGGKDLPVLAETFLPETAQRLPRDPRLLAVSSLRSVATAVALSLFDTKRAAELERQLAAGIADR